MADESNINEAPKPDGKPEEKPDPDAGAKKALEAERAARAEAEKKAKELEERLKAIEDKDKSEVERLTEQVAALTKERDAATVSHARVKVALEKGLTLTQAKRLVGDTEEELSADADELLADLGVGEQEPKPAPAGKPREQLKPGNGDPDVPVEETDVIKLGERMFAR